MAQKTLAVTRNDRQYRGSDERYTPPWLLDRVSAFLGPHWFDPCPAGYGKAPVVNGLEIPWPGHVYCNPPYSAVTPWVVKFLTEPMREGLLLVPAYTDVRWFQPLMAQPICFLRGRLRFTWPDGKADRNSPAGSVLVYRGRRVGAFAEAFGDLGPILRQYQPRQRRQQGLWEVTA